MFDWHPEINRELTNTRSAWFGDRFVNTQNTPYTPSRVQTAARIGVCRSVYILCGIYCHNLRVDKFMR